MLKLIIKRPVLNFVYLNKVIRKKKEPVVRIYLVGGETANHVNFMQIMLVTHHVILGSQEGNIRNN